MCECRLLDRWPDACCNGAKDTLQFMDVKPDCCSLLYICGCSLTNRWPDVSCNGVVSTPVSFPCGIERTTSSGLASALC